MFRSRFLTFVVFVSMVMALVPLSHPAAAVSTTVVISQVYGGGGNSGATFKNDFIELFNRGSVAVDVTGWSVQYASAAGTSWAATPLSGTIQPGQYYLVQEAAGAGGTTNLPTPDATGTIAMSATNAKVALVNSTTALTGSGCPFSATVVDFVGYGTANCAETSATLTLSNTTAASRKAGVPDTDSNSADFAVGAPNPHNTAYVDAVPAVASTTPGDGATGVATNSNLSVTFSEPVAAGSGAFAVTCDSSGSHAVTTTGGPLTFTVDPTVNFAVGELCAATVVAAEIQDQDGFLDHPSGDRVFSFRTADVAPTISVTSPGAGATSVALNANITLTFSEPVDVTGTWFTIGCATSDGHEASATTGPTTFQLDPVVDFAANETCTVTVLASQVTDQDTIDPPDTMTADYVFRFTTIAAPTFIHDIQGASHLSPMTGLTPLNVPGVVTAKRTNGFYMQDTAPDGNEATSEGIFVFTGSAPTVNVGDAVSVRATVQEFRPGGAANGNLTTTELVSPTVTVLSSGNALPTPVVIGTGGRIPPNQVIEDDASGSVESSGVFDPANDGVDFYESLEGMRVQVNNAVAVGPTNSFGETPIIGDDGANALVRTARGGILLRPDDGNPERLIADDVIVSMPKLNVGDHYSGPIVGVLDYNFGNFFLEVTQSVGRIDNGLQRETATAPSTYELAVATFNFENLDPTDPQSKFDQLATYIVQSLRSPDLIGGEEVQDNNGATDNGIVDASATLSQLVAAIQAAGGPRYEWREIDPANDQDGGEPGGNIRQVFLFRTDRGLSFVDRPGATATAPTRVTGSGASTQLTLSPGRIDPTNPNGAWNSSRKPLVGEFVYRGEKVFAIVNHFNSKGGDDPLMGRFQPPVQISATQRHKQATIVADFVSQITAADSNANVIVIGDLNDFEFSETVTILKNAGLHDFIETLPLNQRYSYEFEGNAQVLDHIMGSDAVFARLVEFDAVHVNAEFADQASDHDPSVIRVLFNRQPTVSAGGPYTVDEGSSITVTGSGTDPDGDPITFAWDLDNNGTFETAGQTAIFSAAALDGPTTRTVSVRATDNGGLTATTSTTITVANVAPTATLHAPSSGLAGSDFVISLTDSFDPSVADTAAGFTFAFNCGPGYGAFGSTSSVSCPTTVTGDRSAGAKIKDKDGGVTEYQATVHVVVTFDSLCALARSYATKSGVGDSLCAKVDNAAAARDRGNVKAAQNILKAFANEVEAQRGKAIASENADTLIALAGSL